MVCGVSPVTTLQASDGFCRVLSPKTVLLLLQTLPKDAEARERQARCAWYLNQLIRLSHQKKNINRRGEIWSATL